MADSGIISITIGGAVGATLQDSVRRSESLISDLGTALGRLKQTAGQITEFQQLSGRVDKTSERLKAAQNNLAALRQELQATANPTKKLTRETDRAEQAVERLNQAQREQQERLGRLQQELTEAGIDTRNLAQEQERLARATRQASAEQRQLGQAQSDLQGARDEREQIRGDFIDTAALVLGFVNALRPAVDFESAIADVNKVVGFDGPKALAKFRAELLALAQEIPLTVNQLAEIAAAGGRLGLPEAELISFTRLVSQASVALDLLPDKAGQAIATLSNVFQVPIGDIRLLIDGVVELGNNTAATEAQIIDFLVRAGGLARQFKLTTTQTAALGAAFVSLGRQPEVAARAVNRLLINLQTADKQSAAFRRTLTNLGLSATELAERIRADPQAALLALFESLEELSGKDRTGALAELVGVEFADDFAVLTGSLDEYRKALALVADEQTFAGATLKEFTARLKTTQTNFDLFVNAARRVAIAFGTALLPAVDKFLLFVSSVLNAVASLAEKFEALAAAIGLAVAAFVTGKLGALLVRVFGNAKTSLVALMTLQFGSFTKAVGSADTVVGALNTSAARTTKTLTGLSGVASALFAGLLGVTRKFLGLVKRFGRGIGYGIIIGQVIELIGLIREANRLTGKQAKEREQAIADARALAEVNQSAADTRILSAEELAALPAIERLTYRERLESARTFYRARQREAIAAGNTLRATLFGFEGELGANSEQALQLGLQARVFEQALKDIEKLQKQRAESAADFADQVADAKKLETKVIRTQLEEQLRIFRETNEKLAALQKARETILGSFDELITDLDTAPAAGGQPGVLDLLDQISKAGDKLSGGDLQAAIDLAIRARDLIRTLSEGADVNVLDREFFSDQAERTRTIAEQALTEQEAKLKASRQTAENQINALLERAGRLKRLEIGYDLALAKQSTEKLRQVISEILTKTGIAAIEVPIKFVPETGELESQADKLLEKVNGGSAGGGGEGFSGGGPVGLAAGGYLPGYGGGDRRPAVLEDGEFVARKEAVKRYGVGLFDALNRMILPPRVFRAAPAGFQSGGLVGAAGGGRALAPVHVHLGGREFALQGDRRTARELLDTLRGEARKTARRTR